MLLRLAYSLQNVPWIVTVNSSAGMISIVWLIHYLGMFLMVGPTVFMDLRILGLAGRKLDTSRLAGALFPWMWVGLVDGDAVGIHHVCGASHHVLSRDGISD